MKAIVRLILFLAVLSLIGCAPPGTLKPERAAEIRKVGLITRIPKNELTLLNHTINKTYLYNHFPVVDAMVEKAVLAGVNSYKARKSVKGDAGELSPFVPYSTIKASIDTTLGRKLAKKYVVISSLYFEDRNASADAKDGWFAEGKKAGIDTLVFLDIVYGLAGYDDQVASVSVDADLTVYDVPSEDILLSKRIESDQEFKEHRTVEELAKDDGKLFKEDLNAAIEGFSTYVAHQLGVWE